MSAWLKRFGLHLAAAVGATGIFVAAAAVGASQTRQHEAATVSVPATVVRTRTPVGQRKPSVVFVATPTSIAAAQPAAQTAVDSIGPATPRATSTGRQSPSPSTPATQKVAPERSLAGTI